MIRQWLAAVLAFRLRLGCSLLLWRRCLGPRLRRLHNLGVLLQVEIELIQTFRFGAEAMAVGAVQLVLKLFDLEAQRLDLISQKAVHSPQLHRVFRCDIKVLQHP